MKSKDEVAEVVAKSATGARTITSQYSFMHMVHPQEEEFLPKILSIGMFPHKASDCTNRMQYT